MKEIRLVILSGPSGAGKSTAMNVLEDMNFFCVDNLPVMLLPKFLELSLQSREITKLATVVDVRGREFLKDFPLILKEIKESGYNIKLLYLESSDDALIRRFSETRRKHPLAPEESPIEGIIRERKILKEVKDSADDIIDTTDFNVHQLKEIIRDHFSEPAKIAEMTVNLVSFGYRYGIPQDADIVMDVRFLPNPYFIDEFRGLDGRDNEVKIFINNKPEAREFIERFMMLMDYLIPLYRNEGKSYLTISIGCTGGKHRSVSIVDEIAGNIKSDKCILRKIHRDVEKP
ncbi:MAG: RNase adapter RapZ [Thermodesulfobacteriota bacterium]